MLNIKKTRLTLPQTNKKNYYNFEKNTFQTFTAKQALFDAKS